MMMVDVMPIAPFIAGPLGTMPDSEDDNGVGMYILT